jgi:uncharacterized membrane protein YfcA
MQHIYEALIFIVYSFLAPIVTAGGSMITTNALNIFTGIDIIKATGLTSTFFLINATISLYVFRKEIVWRDARNLLIPCIIGSFIGALFLVNMDAVVLLLLMFIFSVQFIYKKIKNRNNTEIVKDSFWKEQGVGFFAGAVTGAALPGGGFLNSYFASKGFTLSQMFGTLSFILPVIFLVKVSVMVESNIISPRDLIGVLYATPFLIISNILIRKGMIKLSKKMTDNITIIAMGVLSVYLLVSIIKIIIK